MQFGTPPFCLFFPAPPRLACAAIMCGVWRHRFVVPTQFPVWGALLAGGLLGERTCERLLIGAVDCTAMPCQLAFPGTAVWGALLVGGLLGKLQLLPAAARCSHSLTSAVACAPLVVWGSSWRWHVGHSSLPLASLAQCCSSKMHLFVAALCRLLLPAGSSPSVPADLHLQTFICAVCTASPQAIFTSWH